MYKTNDSALEVCLCKLILGQLDVASISVVGKKAENKAH